MTSIQLKNLIHNLSKESNIGYEVLLRNFMMERFLERVAISDYKHNFILKGGILIASMVGIETRSTMDIDAIIKRHKLNRAEITTIIKNILEIPIEDGVRFILNGIEEIREDADYYGFRVSISATFDKINQLIKIDITAGDFITPKEIEYSFNLMFENRAINIMAYNLETLLSEKFETIIVRGVANTRMRDFYDIYILTTTQSFDINTFKLALNNTTKRRETTKQMTRSTEIIQVIEKSPFMIDLWQKYQKKYIYASNISWDMVINAIKTLGEKI
jgi:hypothetical protein